MDDYVPGQRWISDAELQLGLGLILERDARRVTVAFPATGETRTYALEGAPLTRVRFAPGDLLASEDGWQLRVTALREGDGVIIYEGLREDGEPASLPEYQLDHRTQLSRASDRLLSGQVDGDKWFELRVATLQWHSRLMQSDMYGLIGGRTSLLPHQLYIAHEVAHRYAPRVLLADEVGLGKTIEAGMILHQQLLTGRAARVLILVPESLVYQWLVEMLRRFNLRFSIFDEERCVAIEESSGQANPFHSEQLVLCSVDFLAANPQRAAQARAGQFDLLVVDEAHHLAWSPQRPSAEYQLVEGLAGDIPGVLLLTATPEQLGKASHFARLRLLDPVRFPDFDAFVAEEADYEPVARAVDSLLSGEALDEATRRVLADALGETDNRHLLEAIADAATAEEKQALSEQLIEHLLDRHGTGRVLFRNTREAVKGFPERELHDAPLPLPEAYAELVTALQATSITRAQELLRPERLHTAAAENENWCDIDPRVAWLRDRLRSLRPAKVLVIAACAETVLELAAHYRQREGLHVAVFHEGMGILERDRAAAYFADPEGAQVLVCSEIGSEGRNFQFAHHLVLFDLPLDPDLLEQRIGRLDRIGQTQTIRIHVPWLRGSAQEVMFRWFHEGLDAFLHTCPSGQAVFAQVREELLDSLHQLDEGLRDLPALLATSRALNEQYREQLTRGRDRLLEYNSCRPRRAMELYQRALGSCRERELAEYMEDMFDCFGVDSEPHGEQGLVLRAGDRLQSSYFPGLPEDGLTVTWDRRTALVHEDIGFLSWEHPLVTDAMDMVMSNEYGNTAMTALRYKGAQAGTLLLDCIFVVQAVADTRLGLARYLPATTIRKVVDAQGRDHARALSFEVVRKYGQKVDRETARKVVRSQQKIMRKLLDVAEQVATKDIPPLVEAARREAETVLLGEADRLSALQRNNPNVREDEIAWFRERHREVNAVLDSVELRLDAVRAIILV